MERCFQLALLGEGKVQSNPLVGAVIVKNGEIISEGWHRYFGGDHAEIDALKNAAVSAEGSVLYCNLEPCCHTNKKTPPCVPAIIAAGISRVVISSIDPNPEVSGKGVEQLRDAGIEVVTGVLSEKGRNINIDFFNRMLQER